MQKRKLKFIGLALLTLHFSYFSSQNIVSNPSFESYTNCPTTTDQIYYSSGWKSYRVTPDYFNSCATSGGLSVPSNGFGYQNSASGNAYAGFTAYDIGGLAREIIGGQLTQTLSIGQKYFISLKVSLAEFDATTKQYIPCNKIGVKFSSTAFSTVTPVPINNLAHVYTNTIISDTLNWTTIKGVFTADSSYKFIMLGNFFDDFNTDTTYRVNGVRSYFYVDDICVSTDSLTCFNSTNISEFEDLTTIKVFPNPTSSYLIVENLTDKESIITICNSLGVECFKKSVVNQSTIDTSLFSNGIYTLNIKSKNTNYTRKIIINH